MKTYIQAQGFDVWRSIVDGYKVPATPLTDRDGKNIKENNSRYRNTIKNGVTQAIHTNIMHCDSTKEMWDKLNIIYEGDTRVKDSKLQIFIAKFEQLKIKEDENMEAYFLRFDEIVKSIKVLGDEIKEWVIVKKELRSLPMRLDSKNLGLEEREDLDAITMDAFNGILMDCEMRT
jgi:hypothetical protein